VTFAVICELELSEETLLTDEPALTLLELLGDVIELIDEELEERELPVELLLLLELERDEPVDDDVEDIEEDDIDDVEEDDDCPFCPQTASWTQRRNSKRIARRSSDVMSWSK
jgi:hypothetical protein